MLIVNLATYNNNNNNNNNNSNNNKKIVIIIIIVMTTIIVTIIKRERKRERVSIMPPQGNPLLLFLQIFQGNRDRTSRVYNFLKYPKVANMAQLRPYTWHGRISMRLDFFECKHREPKGEILDTWERVNSKFHCPICPTYKIAML